MADRGDEQYREVWFDFMEGVQDNRPKFMVEPRHASRMSGFYPYFGALRRMPHCKEALNLGTDFVNEQIQGLHEWKKPNGDWETLIAIGGDIYTWPCVGTAVTRINVLAGRGLISAITTKVVNGISTTGANRVSFILELLQGEDDTAGNTKSNRWWGAPEAGTPDQFKLDADAETHWGDIDQVHSHTAFQLINNYTGTTGSGLNAAWSVRKCFGAGARVFFEDIHDAVLIWSDAGTRLFRWDGTTFSELGQRTWQDFEDSPAQGPQTLFTPAAGGGSGTMSGKYQYRAVYVDARGNYSAPTDESASVTVTSDTHISLNDFRDKKYWPVGTETVRFYRTKAIINSDVISTVVLAEATQFLNQGYFRRLSGDRTAGGGYHVKRKFSAAQKTLLQDLIAEMKKGTGAWDINVVNGLCAGIIGFACATRPKNDWRTFVGHLEHIIANGAAALANPLDLLSSFAFTEAFDTDDTGDWFDNVLDAGREMSDTAEAYESNLPPRHHVTSLVQFGGRLLYSVERSETPVEDTLEFENYGQTFAQDIQVSGRVAGVSPTGGIGEYHYGGTYISSVGTDYEAVKAQFVLNGEVFAVKENGVWRLDIPTSDPVDWGYIKVNNDANVLNNSAVLVKGSAAFLLGRRNLKCRLWLFDGRRAMSIAKESLNIESGSISASAKWTSMVSWREFVVINHSQAGHRGHLVTLISEDAPGGIFEWRWMDACPMFSSARTQYVLGCGMDDNSRPQVLYMTEITVPDTLPSDMAGHYEIETPESDGGDPTVEKSWQSFWVELTNNKTGVTLEVTAYFDETPATVAAVYALPNNGTKRFLQQFSLKNARARRVYFHLEFAGITAVNMAKLIVAGAGVRFVPLKTAGRPVT